MLKFLLISIALILVQLNQQNSVECLRKVLNKPVHAEEFKDVPGYQTFYYKQFIDHFNFNDDRTFQQRYLVNGSNFF
jgi:hypothetical protein